MDRSPIDSRPVFHAPPPSATAAVAKGRVYSVPAQRRATLREHIKNFSGACIICNVPGPCPAAIEATEYLDGAGLPRVEPPPVAPPLLTRAAAWLPGWGQHRAPEPPAFNSRGWVSA